jgi:hypothetical protein
MPWHKCDFAISSVCTVHLPLLFSFLFISFSSHQNPQCKFRYKIYKLQDSQQILNHKIHNKHKFQITIPLHLTTIHLTNLAISSMHVSRINIKNQEHISHLSLEATVHCAPPLPGGSTHLALRLPTPPGRRARPRRAPTALPLASEPEKLAVNTQEKG